MSIDTTITTVRPSGTVSDVDSEVRDVLDLASRFVTTEYASLTRDGRPVTFPVSPYPGDGTIDVSTGLTYPLKAERARRDPRVTLGFSDPTGSGIDDAPAIIVKGLATVRDADLVETSARYLRVAFDKVPEGRRPPDWLTRRMAWYWTRIWIEVTPVEVLWWPGGRLDEPPRRWHAPSTVVAPPSDPAPQGRPPGSWSTEAPPWRERVEGATARFGAPVVTVVDRDGWPLPLRTRSVCVTNTGFAVRPPVGVDVDPGPACVTFHHHGPGMEFQENVSLVADATVAAGGGSHPIDLRVQRALSDWSLPSTGLRGAIRFVRSGRSLRSRLEHEAARRGTVLPTFDQVRPDAR